MSALAEALLAAQRQAVAALSKAYVGSIIDDEMLLSEIDRLGLRDAVDQGLLLESLSVVKRFGGEMPKNGATTPREAKPASEAQWKLLRRLADERSVPAPDGPLTVEQASKVIEELKAGTYNADAWSIPF